MQAKQLAQPVDVLIGTPQRLLQHAERGNLFWGCGSPLLWPNLADLLSQTHNANL